MKRLLITITLLVGASSYGQVESFSVEQFQYQEKNQDGLISISPPVGTLHVQGDQGSGQDSEYAIYGCKGTLELVQKHSCKYLRIEKLNKDSVLTEGVYRLVYANSRKFIQIKANEVKLETLDRIEIEPKGYSYHVFQDLTDENMQHSYMMDTWSSMYLMNYANLATYFFCREKHQGDIEDVCRNYNSYNFEEFSGIFKFDDDGNLLQLQVSMSDETVHWKSIGRVSITHTSDNLSEKTFVSVFRGTYIVKFTRGSEVFNIYGVKSSGNNYENNSVSIEQN